MRGPRAEIVARFRQAIETGIHKGWRIADYARHLDVSVSMLRGACLKVARKPPLRLIEDRILLEAKRLLLYSDMTIAETAYSLGFDDPAYFSRVFSRNVRQSPRAFREQRAFARIDGRRLLAEDDLERLRERIDAAREARTLYQALLDLPESQRAVLELVVVDDLTVTEAAAALDLRVTTARVRLHRARAALRQAGAIGQPADDNSLFTPLETS